MNQHPAPDSALILQLRAQVSSLQRELAQARQREAEALRAARIDGLTGLPNRRLLEQQVDGLLDRHAAGQAQLAVLFIDLDAFKAINDCHGHAVGDALLRLVGRRLRHAMRREDLACRIGGDEFVCVLQGLRGGDEMAAIEAKLHDLIAQPCHLGDLTLQVRPSIGAALFPRDGGCLSDLMAHADRVMYGRKHRVSLAGRQGPAGGWVSEPKIQSHQPWVTP